MQLSVIVLGYFVGSIPFAFLMARRAAGVDLRLVGSGNVGATNVFRATGTLVALAVVALDVAKGCAIVLVADRVGADQATRVAAGVATIVGHVYPVWLRFQGGKGVATAGGVFGVLSPMATALAAAMFVLVAWRTRYVSIASVVASTLLVVLAYLVEVPPATLAGAVAAAGLIIYRHRGNLVRVRAGTERRLGGRS